MKPGQAARSFKSCCTRAGFLALVFIGLVFFENRALAETVYTVQVASFGSPENARRLAGTLRSGGFDAFACRLRDNRELNWYVVLVGPFDSRQDAVLEKTRYRRNTGAEAFVKAYERPLLLERLIDGTLAKPSDPDTRPHVTESSDEETPSSIRETPTLPAPPPAAPPRTPDKTGDIHERAEVKQDTRRDAGDPPPAVDDNADTVAIQQREKPDSGVDLLAGFDDDTKTVAVRETAQADSGMDLLEGFDDGGTIVTAGSSPSTTQNSDLLDGFDDTGFSPPPKAKDQAPSVVTEIGEARDGSFADVIGGFVRIGATRNFGHKAPVNNATDWRGLSRLRPELQIEINQRMSDEWRLKIAGRATRDFVYEIHGKENYTLDVLEHYESEAEFGEAYLLGRLTPKLDIRFGRQIVPWGKSDTLRVVDILNPVDNREPALTDIEDLRLPVTMTRLDYYIGDWNLTGIAIHEIRFNKNPEFGNDFYPSTTPLPRETIPDNGGDNTEFALSAAAARTGWDIAFYAARLYDDAFYLESVSTSPVRSGDTRFGLHLDHALIRMLGAAFNLATGSWLVKSELAFFEGVRFFNPARYDGAQFVKTSDRSYSRVDTLAGFEYMGLTDTNISLDAVFRYINDYDDFLEQAPYGPDRSEFQWVARGARNFLRDTLMLELLLSGFGWKGENGAFQRFLVEYDVSDNLGLRTGILLFQSGDAMGFATIGDNDRAFLELKYRF